MQEQDKKKAGVVETYADDMAKVLEGDDRGGLIKKIIHGEAESEAEKKNLSPESTKNRLFLVVSFILILVAFGTLLFFINNKDISTLTINKQFEPLIFTDASAVVPVKGLSRDEIIASILKEVGNNKIKNGGVEGLYFTSDEKRVGLRELASLLKLNFIPGSADFIDDNFLIGIVKGSSEDIAATKIPAESDPFILIKVRSFPDVFTTFNSWENKLFFDLHDFFSIPLSSETEYLLTKDFDNGIIENKNARVLYDKDGQMVMAYIFADDNSVIVANTLHAVREIILRLSASKVAK